MARGQQYLAVEDREDEELELLPLNDPSTTTGAADAEIQEADEEAPEATAAQDAGVGSEFVTMRQFIPAIIVPALVSNIGRQLVAPVLPVFAKEELGLSEAAVGTLLSLEGLGGVIINIPAGSFVSRFGSITASFIGMSCQILAAIMAGFSTVAAQLFVSRFVSGTSLSVWNMARQFFVSNALSAKQRGKASSLTGGTMRIAQAIGPLIGGVLADYISVRSVFLGQAVVSGITCLLVMIFMRPLDKYDLYGDKAKAKDKASKAKAKGDGRTDDEPESPRLGCLAGACPCTVVVAQCWRQLLAGGVYSMLLMAARNSRPLLFPLVGHSIGLSKTAIGGVQAAGAAVDSCLILVAGWISDNYGRKWSGLPSSAILSLAFVLLGYAQTLPVLVAASVLAGFGNGFSSGIVNLLGADTAVTAGALRGEYLGLFRTLSDAGNMLGPLVMGCIASATSLKQACMAMGLISAVATLWLAACYWGLGWLSEPWETDNAVSPNAAAPAAVAEKKAPAPVASEEEDPDEELLPASSAEEADEGLLPSPGFKQGAGGGADAEVTSDGHDIELASLDSMSPEGSIDPTSGIPK